MSCRIDVTLLLVAMLLLRHGSVKAGATHPSFTRQVHLVEGSCRLFVELARGFIILKGEGLEPHLEGCG